MAIFAISDLHLSFAEPKPMDVFGAVWTDHPEKIRANWEAVVGKNDIVLMPGDLSWGMRLSDARPDLAFVDRLPGRKILTRGNHDYWWGRKATSRIQKAINRGMTLLQGTSIVIGDVGITGTRGWRPDWELRGGMAMHDAPVEPVDEAKSGRILRRELEYLENGLCSIPDSVRTKIAMLHFPPFNERLQPNEFAEVLSRHSVDILVYGHVHTGVGNWLEGEVGGVRYQVVSADVVGFMPQLIVA